MDWEIPSDKPYGTDYWIKITRSGKPNIYGVSDRFAIGGNTSVDGLLFDPPSPIDFGSILVDTSTPKQTLKVTNTALYDITISGIDDYWEPYWSAQYSSDASKCKGSTLKHNDSCTITDIVLTPSQSDLPCPNGFMFYTTDPKNRSFKYVMKVSGLKP